MLYHKLAKNICTLCCICFLQTNITFAQEHQPLPPTDTLRVDLRQTEKMFLENNLQLLAQKYSIDSARAAIITARLFDNPQFGVSSGLYNPSTSKFFDYSNGNGEVAMQ